MTVIQKISDHIAPFMKEQGFCYKQKCFYKIHNDIAFCVQLDATVGLIHATYFVMPLYIPCSSRYYSYGKRITDLSASRLAALPREASDDEIAKWCTQLCSYLETTVFPLFHRISTPKQMVKLVEWKLLLRQDLFSCPPVLVLRLLMFSYLYLGERGILQKTIKKYEKALKNSSFFTNEVRSYFLEEMDLIKRIVQQGDDSIRNYCSATIADAVSKCFT